MPDPLPGTEGDQFPLRDGVETIPVVVETARVEKRLVETGRAIIRKTVSERDEVVNALLARHDVTVERIQVDRVVDELPVPHQEGDTWVIPILEERLVVETQLVLKEELRVRTTTRHEAVQQTVRLRQEHVDIETVDPRGAGHPGQYRERKTEMSGNYTNTDRRSDSLNQAAAHDTGLYDPNRHDNQIVAVYETRAQAEAARDALLGAGIPQSTIQVLDRTSGDAVAGVTRAEDRNQDEGFWGAVKSLFAPEDDYHAYHHAIGRGHAMVMVTPTGNMDRHRIIQVLESSGPIDFDAKLEEWRQAGYDSNAAPHAADLSRGGTGHATGLAAAGARAAESVATHAGEAVHGALNRAEDTIKVVEERLRVGKREVAQGAVRVRSYVVERPVEEQVRLHEERISVERRPVDRVVTPSDTGMFKEQTIEARATSEEAVVQKEARVVEEIGIRKESQDRTETVRDTVRETKVEVDDKGAHTGMGTGGVASNATPGATTSGMNSPRK